METTLENHSIVVTGGGSGIGRAIARRLVNDGATVTICGRRADILEATAAELNSACSGPGRVLAIAVDVTDERAMGEAVARAAEAGNGVTGAVANAGGSGQMRLLHEISAADIASVLNLNVVGTFNLLKFTVPLMIERRGGSFVGISSGAAAQTSRYFGAYTAAKAAVDVLLRNAADEYGGRLVRFNSVRPGFTMSEKMASLVPADDPVRESYVVNTPLPGVGEMTDVANLVRFLLGPEARWITGEAIAVDGGNNMRTGPDISSMIPI
ncbi:SDR family oxidoreductase [Streptomyces sp. NPDC050619]|uniref:SDR family oxidoreductase n=1 Tax=Streptomyces sp. NPDC050619 TaxID=3157214 RepID=UPI0034378233